MQEGLNLVEEFSSHFPQQWDEMLLGYDDCNIYQTFGWGEFKKGQGWKLLRLICYRDNKDIAMSQCLLRHYKLLGLYVIWIPGGPLFLKNSGDRHMDGFCSILRLIRERCKVKRYYIRVYPMQSYDSSVILSMRETGFQRPIENINYGLTYLIETSQTEEEILKSLSSNWRHNLKRSLKAGLNFVHSDSQESLARFYEVYIKTVERNKLKRHYLLKDLMSIKGNLPPSGHLNLFLSMSGQDILSGRIVCTIGEKAYDILAATTNEGRRLYSSYLLVWKIINWCREKKIRYLDMSGIDPFRHKGVFNFKKGIGGKPVEYLGEWENTNSNLLRLALSFYISKYLKD